MKRKNRILAAFLAFIGGSFGIHKFYLGHSVLGVMFILLTIFIVPRIGFPLTFLLGIIDAIRLFTMGERNFDRKYNSGHVRRTYGPPKPRRRINPQENRKRKVPQRSVLRKRPKRKATLRKNPYKKSGLIKFKDYRYQEAVEDFKKGLEISPKERSLHFNIACAYSLLEKKEKAFVHLSKAVENGFKDTNKIHVNDALSFIRVQKEFDFFVKNGYNWPSQKGTQKIAPSKEIEEEVLSKLKKLKDLREKGSITEMEYQRAADRLRN